MLGGGAYDDVEEFYEWPPRGQLFNVSQPHNLGSTTTVKNIPTEIQSPKLTEFKLAYFLQCAAICVPRVMTREETEGEGRGRASRDGGRGTSSSEIVRGKT